MEKMEKSKSRTRKGISKENLVALTGGLEISTEKRPKMLGEKSKIDEKEVEKVRQEAVLNSLKYIIDNPDKMKDANTLLGKASLLVTPEETRRLALLKSKEILAYKSQIEAGSRKGFENGKNPA